MSDHRERRLTRWIEILSVLAIVVAVIALAVPKSAEVRRARTAVDLLSDVEIVRKAVYRFYSDSAYFPAQVPGAPVPDGLREYLPRGFTARKPYGTLDYRNWPMARRDSTIPAANVIGVTVSVHDPRIGAAAHARAHDIPKFAVRGKYTFLFFGS